ncbi:4Fe-4S binding protein [Geoglobus acetivorans]|uniref:4Fe-4S binding protein n=1 Tax=Geoglobus acetivorans TaxID=565033 RepID=A0ABZ3H572_GEOAI|nr:4Fe-4S binding protein [Geoglobus acetivorans]
MMLELIYDSSVVKEPILVEVALEEKVLMNIIEAEVGAREGRIVIEIDDVLAENIISRFEDRGVEVRRLVRGIEMSEACVDCGACISVCPVSVFYKDSDERVVADPEKCVRCRICIGVCPLKALSLPE